MAHTYLLLGGILVEQLSLLQTGLSSRVALWASIDKDQKHRQRHGDVEKPSIFPAHLDLRWWQGSELLDHFE